jgi:hypothetical protein
VIGTRTEYSDYIMMLHQLQTLIRCF